MGMAATQSDRDRLRALSRLDPEHRNCAFACHMPTRLDGSWRTSEERAHANGVTLRIDVMKQNVLGLISELQEEDHNVVRYSVSALSRDFRTVIAQTDDVGRVERAVRMFSLSGEVHNNRNGASLLSDAIAQGARRQPERGGDGSAERPRNYVVIVTDGMQFDWGRVSSGPIDQDACDDLKRRGIGVAVVQLRYVDLTGDGSFDYWVRPHYYDLGPALERCATSGLFFSADSPAEVRRAFAELGERLREAVRLVR